MSKLFNLPAPKIMSESNHEMKRNQNQNQDRMAELTNTQQGVDTIILYPTLQHVSLRSNAFVEFRFGIGSEIVAIVIHICYAVLTRRAGSEIEQFWKSNGM